MPRSAVAWVALLAIAVAFGIYLRATQLATQVLVDDEWHAIHKVLHSDAKGIVTSFGVADYSIPLTLYYRFLSLHGCLTEWEMHLPLLLAGIASLLVAPYLLRRTVSLPVAATWVALLAISPLHVYLSRTARPYALTCLLSLIAVLAFRQWWFAKDHRMSSACAYVVATFLAGWLHLVTLSFTLLPFVWFGVLAMLEAKRGVGDARRFAPLRRLALLAIATIVPLAVALLPPLLGSFGQLAEKAGTDSVSVASVYRTLLMLAGVRAPALLAVLAALGIVGVVKFMRRDAGFVGYVGFLALGSAAAIVLARPAWIQHPGVLARYTLPALPFALLFVAEGAVRLAGWLRPAFAIPLAIVLGVAMLFESGPIPTWLYRPNQFIGHARFQFDYDPAHNPYVRQIPKEPIPAFYRELATRPPASLTLIEAPWRLESNFDPFPWYQQVHRQYVKIGLVTPVCGVRDFGEFPPDETRLRFRWFVHVARLLQGESFGARYLVMHRSAWKTPPDASVEWPDVDACLPRIEARLGAPVYRDERIVVFDLAARAGVNGVNALKH
ncbi:MAG TPA: hypothetical protein VGL96_07815 [Casimicrobiaceae bacterium]